jgi:hypothetical protein
MYTGNLKDEVDSCVTGPARNASEEWGQWGQGEIKMECSVRNGNGMVKWEMEIMAESARWRP